MWIVTIKHPFRTNQDPKGEAGRDSHTLSLCSYPSFSGQLPLCHFPSLLQWLLGRLGEETGEGPCLGAEDFHYGLILQSLWLQSDPKYHWEQQCEGLEAPGGKGLGAAWQLLKLSQRRKLLLPLGELGDATRVFPLQSPQPLLTFESPRRRKQSSWGWDGECRASVTVRAHCRGPFSFPLGRLRFRVFLLRSTAGA